MTTIVPPADILPGRPTSLWIDAETARMFAPLERDVTVDVAVVGGGIVGMTTALLLKRAGRTVAVIEQRRVGQQVTGRSTAKITSLHGLTYATLIQDFGEAGARTYAEANQAAIERIAGFVTEMRIDCGFQRKAAYTYAQSPQMLSQVEAEVEAARKLGLPASFVPDVPLPFPTLGAVKFDNQAQFDAFDYVAGLAADLPGDGCHIFEETRALDVDEGESCRVRTDRGTITARDVIVATNLPFLDRGGFFARAYPRAHLVMAARIEGAPPDGMFLSADTPTHSIRAAGANHPGIVVVAGPSFKTGHETDTAKGYRDLERFIREHFTVTAIENRWMNQDYDSADGVPYVGKLLPGSDHVYVATGFKAWGITNGTAAAEILSDAVLDRQNAWADLFDSTRAKVATSARTFVSENLHVARHFAKDRLGRAPRITPDDLAPGSGTVATIRGERVAISKDADGRVFAVSAICRHMGCDVSWNNAEMTWDCACHGSRYTSDGRVIHGPTVYDLEPRNDLLAAEPTHDGRLRTRSGAKIAAAAFAAAALIVATGVVASRAVNRRH